MTPETARLVDQARQIILELCEGKRRWTMSIPARVDHDPDLVISRALVALTTELQEAREALDNKEQVVEDVRVRCAYLEIELRHLKEQLEAERSRTDLY